VFDSVKALAAMRAEQAVRSILDLARAAEVALVGIGNPASGSSATLLGLLADSDEQLARFWSACPVGDVCGRYYDISGNPLEVPGLTDRILAIEALDLRKIPVSIGVAVGVEKAEAVLGAIRGGFVNTLVCDRSLAEAVLRDQEPSSAPSAQGAGPNPDASTPGSRSPSSAATSKPTHGTARMSQETSGRRRPS
jgi:DNA-binding transcriptional regulator LsrR (DeoR family)